MTETVRPVSLQILPSLRVWENNAMMKVQSVGQI